MTSDDPIFDEEEARERLLAAWDKCADGSWFGMEVAGLEDDLRRASSHWMQAGRPTLHNLLRDVRDRFESAKRWMKYSGRHDLALEDLSVALEALEEYRKRVEDL